MQRAIDRVMPKIAIPIIAVAGLLIIVLMIDSTRGTNQENNAYIRVINCIVSHNASTRTQDDIENCYIEVERDLNTRLQRYDAS